MKFFQSTSARNSSKSSGTSGQDRYAQMPSQRPPRGTHSPRASPRASPGSSPHGSPALGLVSPTTSNRTTSPSQSDLSARSFRINTEDGGQRDMTAAEVNSLVHNALRKARKATIPVKQSSQQHRVVDANLPSSAYVLPNSRARSSLDTARTPALPSNPSSLHLSSGDEVLRRVEEEIALARRAADNANRRLQSLASPPIAAAAQNRQAPDIDDALLHTEDFRDLLSVSSSERPPASVGNQTPNSGEFQDAREFSVNEEEGIEVGSKGKKKAPLDSVEIGYGSQPAKTNLPTNVQKALEHVAKMQIDKQNPRVRSPPKQLFEEEEEESVSHLPPISDSFSIDIPHSETRDTVISPIVYSPSEAARPLDHSAAPTLEESDLMMSPDRVRREAAYPHVLEETDLMKSPPATKLHQPVKESKTAAAAAKKDGTRKERGKKPARSHFHVQSGAEGEADETRQTTDGQEDVNLVRTERGYKNKKKEHPEVSKAGDVDEEKKIEYIDATDTAWGGESLTADEGTEYTEETVEGETEQVTPSNDADYDDDSDYTEVTYEDDENAEEASLPSKNGAELFEGRKSKDKIVSAATSNDQEEITEENMGVVKCQSRGSEGTPNRQSGEVIPPSATNTSHWSEPSDTSERKVEQVIRTSMTLMSQVSEMTEHSINAGVDDRQPMVQSEVPCPSAGEAPAKKTAKDNAFESSITDARTDGSEYTEVTASDDNLKSESEYTEETASAAASKERRATKTENAGIKVRTDTEKKAQALGSTPKSSSNFPPVGFTMKPASSAEATRENIVSPSQSSSAWDVEPDLESDCSVSEQSEAERVQLMRMPEPEADEDYRQGDTDQLKDEEILDETQAPTQSTMAPSKLTVASETAEKVKKETPGEEDDSAAPSRSAKAGTPAATKREPATQPKTTNQVPRPFSNIHYNDVDDDDEDDGEEDDDDDKRESRVEVDENTDKIEFRHPYPRPEPLPRPRPPSDIVKAHALGIPEPFSAWSVPKPDLQKLITALQDESLPRRSNACGALKVLSQKKINRASLVRAQGFLDGVVAAISSDIPAVKDRDVALDARTRAVTTLLNVSQIKENRAIIALHSGLLDSLVKVIVEDQGEARVQACQTIAVLAKTLPNRERIVSIPGLLSALAAVLSGAIYLNRPSRRTEEEKKEHDNNDMAKGGSDSRDFDEETEDYASSVGNDTLYSSLGDSTIGTSFQEDLSFHSIAISDSNPPKKPKEKDPKSPKGGKDRDKKKIVPNSIRRQKNEQYDLFLKQARVSSCAAMMHLSKHCAVSKIFASNAAAVESLVLVSREFENPIHTKCLEMMCNLTRFPDNNSHLARNNALLEALVKCGKSKILEDRIWSLRAFQNISADASSKVILANSRILTLLSICSMRKDYDEQVAAVAALYNLSTEPGAVVPLTNTKNVVATLVHIGHNAVATPDIRLMACDALATIGLWLQTLSGSGTVPEGVKKVLLPSHTTTGWQRWD